MCVNYPHTLAKFSRTCIVIYNPIITSNFKFIPRIRKLTISGCRGTVEVSDWFVGRYDWNQNFTSPRGAIQSSYKFQEYTYN